MSTARYSLDDVLRSYRWLRHVGWTEVNALHPAYRPGDAAGNRRHEAYPIIDYVNNETGLAAFVARHAGERMVCFGINPRPRIFRHADGRVRSARDADIAVSQNLLLDIDLVQPTPAGLDALRR